MSNSALYKKWSRWLDRIKKEQLHYLLIHRHVFKQLQECASPHVGETYGADLLQWMVQNYVAFATTSIRRMIEKPNPRWRSISFVILLEDMAKHESALTRRRYRGLYERAMPFYKKRKSRIWEFADRDFNSITRNKRATHLSGGRIRRDLEAIERVCKPIKRLVDKVVEVHGFSWTV